MGIGAGNGRPRQPDPGRQKHSRASRTAEGMSEGELMRLARASLTDGGAAKRLDIEPLQDTTTMLALAGTDAESRALTTQLTQGERKELRIAEKHMVRDIGGSSDDAATQAAVRGSARNRNRGDTKT